MRSYFGGKMKVSNIELDLNIIRNGEFENLIKLDETKALEKTLTFLEKNVSEELLNSKNISVVICPKEHVDYYKKQSLGIIQSENPKETFFNLMNYYSGLFKRSAISVIYGMLVFLCRFMRLFFSPTVLLFSPVENKSGILTSIPLAPHKERTVDGANRQCSREF